MRQESVSGEPRFSMLDGAGSLAHAQGDYDRATDRYGELLSTPPTATDAFPDGVPMEVMSDATGGATDATTGPLARAWAAGRALALDDAVGEALAVSVRREAADHG